MASLIGAHFSRNGIKQFPARVVLSMYGNGIGGDETTADTIVILRDTRIFPSGEAPPDFHTFDPDSSGVTWAEYGRYWYSERTEQTAPTTGGPGFRNFKEAWDANQPADYYTICNEQGGGEGPEDEIRANLTQLVNIERAISQAANADGRKCCVGNLAGGSPGNFELWKEIVAPFIVEAWQNGGNIYGRHLYGQADKDANGNDIPETGNLVLPDGTVKHGQPQRVIDELEYLQSIGYGGGVVLTECGLDGGYGIARIDRFTFQIQAWEAALRPYSDILIGFCWWECGDTGFHADYTEHLKTLIPYMNNSYLGRWEPPTTQPPDNGQGGNMTQKVRYSYDIELPRAPRVQNEQPVLYRLVAMEPDGSGSWKLVPGLGSQKEIVVSADKNYRFVLQFEVLEDGDENPNPPVSEKFAIGDRVEITANALNVRAVPSLQGTVVTALPKGSKGTTNDGPTLADNVIWWRIVFDADVTGWCSEAWLEYETASKNPLDGLVLGKPFAVPYALTSPFNAPRSYANGLHEGVDYDVLTAVADSQEPILCLYPGTVDISIDSSGGYGKYVRVRHERNGSTFYTRYAHMDERFVSVGQNVDIGDALGEIGTTGNVTGEHVHINLEVPGYGSSGYVVADVVDPHPYIGSSPAPPPTVPTYDILDYMVGTHRQQHTLQYTWAGGGTQTIQIMQDGNEWRYVKGGGQYEQLYYDDNWIYRAEDTSESADRFYTQSTNGTLGAAWVKRRMAIGETVYTTKQVQHYLKDGCVPQNGGLVTDALKLTAVYPAYTFDSGIVLKDVIRLEWAAGEGYLFAKGYGLVGFEFSGGKSYISELALQGRDDLPVNVPSCLDLSGRYYV